jgi:hypothetical protein
VAKIRSMMPLASIQPHRPDSSRLCSSANIIDATPGADIRTWRSFITGHAESGAARGTRDLILSPAVAGKTRKLQDYSGERGNHKHAATVGGFVAGGPGFEPRLTESESAPSNYQQ